MNLITSLRDSIFRPMADPMIDLGEVLLDTVFEDGALKDIPIIGTIAGMAKVSVAVRERQLAKIHMRLSEASGSRQSHRINWKSIGINLMIQRLRIKNLATFSFSWTVRFVQRNL